MSEHCARKCGMVRPSFFGQFTASLQSFFKEEACLSREKFCDILRTLGDGLSNPKHISVWGSWYVPGPHRWPIELGTTHATARSAAEIFIFQGNKTCYCVLLKKLNESRHSTKRQSKEWFRE